MLLLRLVVHRVLGPRLSASAQSQRDDNNRAQKTQTTNQGFVPFAANPNDALERTISAPTASGLIALPSAPARFYEKIRCWGN